MSSINNKLSEYYGIKPSGETGMEIMQKNGRPVKFTRHLTRFENWQEAVEWARVNVTVKRPDPILVYVTDLWGHRVRVNKAELDNPAKIFCKVYNQYGKLVTETDDSDAIPVIHKSNIVGTAKNEQADPDPDPDPDPDTVQGEGAPQYTFFGDETKGVQLAFKF